MQQERPAHDRVHGVCAFQRGLVDVIAGVGETRGISVEARRSEFRRLERLAVIEERRHHQLRDLRAERGDPEERPIDGDGLGRASSMPAQEIRAERVEMAEGLGQPVHRRDPPLARGEEAAKRLARGRWERFPHHRVRPDRLIFEELRHTADPAVAPGRDGVPREPRVCRQRFSGEILAVESAEVARGEREPREIPAVAAQFLDVFQPQRRPTFVAVDAETRWRGQPRRQRLEDAGGVHLGLALEAEDIEQRFAELGRDGLAVSRRPGPTYLEDHCHRMLDVPAPRHRPDQVHALGGRIIGDVAQRCDRRVGNVIDRPPRSARGHMHEGVAVDVAWPGHATRLPDA